MDTKFDIPLNLRQLVSLVAVADLGNLSKAARELGIAQPSLSRTIRQLETELDTELFERSPKGMTPSAAGRVLVAHAKGVLAEWRRAEAEFAAMRAEAQGHISIGAVPVMAADILPRALAPILEAMPHLHVTIVEELYENLTPGLLEGSMDILLGPVGIDGPRDGVTEEFLFDDQLCIVARAGHALAGRKKLSLADLADQSWILPSVTAAPRRHLENAMRAQGLDVPKHIVETASARSVPTLLIETDRLTVLPRQLYIREEQLGLLVTLPVSWSARSRPLGIHRREHATVSEPTQMLIENLRRLAADINSGA